MNKLYQVRHIEEFAQSAGEWPDFEAVIVGSGACGLTAALMLKDLGVEALVLERDAAASGSTALSSGFVPAAQTLAQKRAGIKDSIEAFAADVQSKAHGSAAPHLVNAYCFAVPKAIDALELNHGVEWHVLDQFLYPGHSQYRMHAVNEKTGEGLMNALLKAAERAELTLLNQAHVLELVLDSQGNIVAVGFSRPDQSMEYVKTQALILACNGFGANEELIREHLPAIANAFYAGHHGNDGAAVIWSKGLGAALMDMGAYQGHGSWAMGPGSLITWAIMMQGGVQINAKGERFHNETQGYSEAAVEVLSQPGSQAWAVIDAELLDLAMGFPDFVQAQKLGAVKRCEDIEQLAKLIACDVEVLSKTLNWPIHDEALAIDQPLQDGKLAHARVFKRRLKPPYFAIHVTGALFHTQGGLSIDEHCRVLNSSGQAFKNLWAAGGAARGVSGNAVWGYLSGNGLLSALAGGFLAAQSVTQHIRSQGS